MNDDRKELKLIQEKLDQLSTKQLELVKANQQQVKTYEQQKTIYQQLFGQPPLPPDPELEAINTQITDLKGREGEYFKVIQAATSVPPPPTLALEKDWSKAPFYSKTLKTWNFDYPVDQMGFYLTSLTGIGIISKAFWKTWNMKLAEKAIQ
jgi:hypothetical protein